MLISIFLIVGIIDIPESIDGLFLFVVILGQHIHGIDIRIPVIVDIGHIIAHGRLGLVGEIGGYLIFKSPVPLINIQEVIGDIVIGDIHIRIAVFIHIPNGQSQAKAFVNNSCLQGYICKCTISVIPV